MNQRLSKSKCPDILLDVPGRPDVFVEGHGAEGEEINADELLNLILTAM